MKTVIYICIVVAALVSCSAEEDDKNNGLGIGSNAAVTGTLPTANGQPGNVLVSIEDDVWKGEIEAVFKAHFSRQAPGPFIGKEPVFDYLQQDPSLINRLGKKNRNFMRIILDKSKTYEETEIIIKKNHVSEGQLYIVIKDSDKSRLVSFFDDQLPTYIALFDDQETERLISNFSGERHFAFDKRAREAFGISIGVPARAKFEADLDTVIYALDKRSKELGDNPDTGAKGGVYWAQKGIIIWESEYTGPESMQPVSLLKERDSTLKYVVKGTLEGSYMATEYYPTHKPKFTQIDVDGAYALQIEGLWIHAGNDAAVGGGPFIQYCIQHPTRNTIVHVTTYIYALNFRKRELYREAGAILKTISVVE